MNRSSESSPRPGRGLVITFVAIVIVVAIGLALRGRAAHAAAVTGDRLVSRDPSRALVWYGVSNLLQSHQRPVVTKIATLQLQGGQAAAAATTIKPLLAQASAADWKLDSQIELELGNNDAAIGAAGKSHDDEQLGLTLAASDKTSDIDQLIAKLPKGTLATELAAAKASQAYLAAVLYQKQLLHSADRILGHINAQSAQTYLLHAVVALKLGKGSKTSLQQAQGYLAKAVALQPARIDLRQALQSVDLKLGDKAGASEQAAKIKALQAGKV